ncbi:MAG TPA: hypothetical protein VKY19_01010 [Ktedonosporobacter sp.]|jgi:hypothetical protein|nr:hypothetical protein [Ktedonosporobacter sp.]
MKNVVPGALQRLRAADIIRMAGLTTASLGQEYCRIGAVHSTQRQEARISGTVDVPSMQDDGAPPAYSETKATTRLHHYQVEVEMQSATKWVSTCLCGHNAATLCVHAAALLYQWLARPSTFAPVFAATPSSEEATEKEPVQDTEPSVRPARSLRQGKPIVTLRTSEPQTSTLDILLQLGLSDLRGIAREYEITSNGLSKPQLAEAIVTVLSQPEAVRRIATTLEKSQRQLLAAITLAGGSVIDEDLRGLYERFSLGHANQLQGILVTLQNKALLFRTGLGSISQQRISLSGGLLDIGWYVPTEVRAALRVMVPSTPYHVEKADERGELPEIRLGEAYNLLADLLLVARALNGYRLEHDDERHERGSAARLPDTFTFTRSFTPAAGDSSVAVPPPSDMPSSSLLSALQELVPRPPAFLRFAVRLLRLADILHKDDSGTPYLRILPNAAQLLLGTARAEVMRDLFELWLMQSSYGELFDLREEGLRLCCRATSLNLPILRSGELDAENSEARQTVIALLAQAPLQQWISFQSFSRFVYRLNPLFLQRRQRLFSSPHWWLEQEEGRPLRPMQLSDWLRADVFYLAHLLLGPLHWWGACDVALSPEGKLLAFRLTPIAGWLLGGVPPDEDTPTHDYRVPSDSLEIIDTEEILVRCSPHAWPVIEILETFTEAAGVRPDRLRYCLTPRALGDALSRGKHPTPLLDLLRTLRANAVAQDGPLPTMVAQLERWVASYGRVRIYTGATLLETMDSTVLRELAVTTSLDKQVVQAIHPTLLVLKKPGAERVIDELKRRGQTPLLHDEDIYGTE